MKRIIVLLVLCAPLLSIAKWRYLGMVEHTEYRSKIYTYNDQPHNIDKKSMTVLMWVVAEPNDPDANKSDSYNNTSTILYKVKCQKPTAYAVVSMIVKSLDGKILINDDFSNEKLEYKYAPPDSIAESIVARACELLKNGK